MKAPANGFAGVNLRASAFAVGHGHILFLARRLGLGLRPRDLGSALRRSGSALCSGHGLRSTGQSLWSEPFMGRPADAMTVLYALVVMPVDLAPVRMHHSAPTES